MTAIFSATEQLHPSSLQPPSSGSGLQVNLVIPDVSTPEPVIVMNRDGETFTLTLSQMQELIACAQYADARAGTLLAQTRKEANHPYTFPLGRETLTQTPAWGDRQPYPKKLAHADTPSLLEGTPYLQWIEPRQTGGSLQGERYGWSLRLMTPNNQFMEVGYAPWDNAEAIESLIVQIADPDTLMLIAGLTNPGVTANTSAAMSLRTLIIDNTAPQAALPPLRRLLTANDLTSDDTNHHDDMGRLRKLVVKDTSTGRVKSFAIAVCLQAPLRGIPVEDSRRLQQRLRGLPREEAQQVRSQARRIAQAAWVREATRIMEADGWHIVNLPLPQQRSDWRGRPVLWATHLTPTEWESIERAVMADASSLAMTSGSRV